MEWMRFQVFGAQHRQWNAPKEFEAALDSEDLLADLGGTEARSPMPGTVEKVLIGEGDRVAKGQALVALNAMKMEFLIRFSLNPFILLLFPPNFRAPFDGTVASINCSVGQSVKKDAILVRLNKDE
jgi:biotin carboxyl carrier protein